MSVFDFIFNLIIVGIIVSIVVIVALFFAIRALVRWIRKGSTANKEYEVLDQTAGATPEQLASVLKRYAHDRAIGSRARAGLTQVRLTDEKHGRLISIVKAKFPETSLSWTKFSSAVDVACQVIMRNCTMLANRIQTFDTADYRELEHATNIAAVKSAQVDGVKLERWNLMNANLREMDDIIAANDQLLLELDKFSAEIGRLGQDEADAATNEMLDEIQQLSEQAKLYE